MDGADPSPRRRRATALASAGVAALAAAAVVLLLTSGGPSRRATTTVTSPPAVTSPAPVGPPAQPSQLGAEQFGASVNGLFNDGTYSSTDIDSQLRELQQTGAKVARSDAFWEAAEPNAPTDGVHRYDWSFDDSIAGSLAAHGLRWLPIIDYSPPWAQSVAGQDHSPPRVPGDYAAYAGALAARYGQGGAFWREHPNLTPEPVDTFEIWNEPDNPAFWSPTPDASGYDELYLLARDAIIAVQPGARVIVGGLTKPAVFMSAMLAARPDMRGHIDGVGIHPYAPNPALVVARVATARRALASVGLEEAPLYVTEFGWTTHPTGARDWAPQRLRPRYISATIRALGHVDCGLAMIILYTWVTPELHLANPQDWFGINPPGGGSSADSLAFAAGLRAGAAPGPPIPLCSKG